MNRAQLVEAIVKDSGAKKKDVETILKSYIDVVEKAVKKGDKVQIVGFGTFERKSVKARKCRNPKTGETIKVAAHKTPAFKAGAAFKNVVAGPKKK